MLDAITNGTGNSRYLKSVSDFLTKYPTYEALADALVAGTLPIDLNGINPEGWAQLGTALDKANLLTDATAALLGLGDEATPNEMFAALANKTLSALSTANAAQGKLGTIITYGTTDLTAGSSPLTTGTIYCMYE